MTILSETVRLASIHNNEYHHSDTYPASRHPHSLRSQYSLPRCQCTVPRSITHATYHNLIHNNNKENRRPRHARRKQQIQQQQRRRNDPVNIPHVKNRAVRAPHLGIRPRILDLDGREAQIRAHGEVRNRRDEDDRGREVVEQAVAAVLAEGQADETEAGDCGWEGVRGWEVGGFVEWGWGTGTYRPWRRRWRSRNLSRAR